MAAINGFFGHLQGPFTANQEIMTLIQAQCNNQIDYLSKLGIHFVGNHKLDIEGNIVPKFYVTINNISFQIGQTRMLELEDIQVTSIIFPEDTNDLVYIDYQYHKRDENI